MKRLKPLLIVISLSRSKVLCHLDMFISNRFKVRSVYIAIKFFVILLNISPQKFLTVVI